jgi:ABC-2 type transport system permease protein
MRIDKILILAKREYLSRVKTKGFWIGTVVFPLLMLVMLLAPALVASRTSSTLHLALVDTTGTVAAAVETNLLAEPPKSSSSTPAPAAKPRDARTSARVKAGTTFRVERLSPAADREAQRQDLDRRVLEQDLDAWVWIDEAGLAKNEVEYHGESVSNLFTQERLADAVSGAVRSVRLATAGYDVAKVTELSVGVELSTVRITKEGGRAERGLAGAIVAYFLFFMLYMMLALYGTQVMNGVIEEKSSRIVELIVSTVRPFELLLGKVIGIGAVGFTQIAIWLATVAVVTAPGIVAAIAWMPDLPQISWTLIVNFLLFFVLGFFLYATYYAALGSAFNDIREAQQAATSAMFLLVPPMLIFPMVIDDPDSTLSVVTSLIPFFTPLLMVLRIAIKQPPLWQLLLGYLLTTATTIGMVWICAKIYRVGILMYGKKPTLQELWRWTRYA